MLKFRRKGGVASVSSPAASVALPSAATDGAGGGGGAAETVTDPSSAAIGPPAQPSSPSFSAGSVSSDVGQRASRRSSKGQPPPNEDSGTPAPAIVVKRPSFDSPDADPTGRISLQSVPPYFRHPDAPSSSSSSPTLSSRPFLRSFDDISSAKSVTLPLGDNMSIASFSSQMAYSADISEETFTAFVASIKEKYEKHPLLSTMPDHEICRFLSAHKGNVAAATKQVGVTLDWRNSFGWNTLVDEDFSDMMASGKLMLKGTDKDGYPIMIWRHSKHLPEEFSLERDIRFIIYTMEKGKREGIVTDRLSLIVDRIGMTPSNHDSQLVKTLLSTFQHHYPDRLARLFIFPKNMMLTMGWNITKVFLDPVTISRIKILGEEEVEATLQQYIDREQLLQRYGGLLVDPTEKQPLSPPTTSSSAAKVVKKAGRVPPPRTSSVLVQRRSTASSPLSGDGSNVGSTGFLKIGAGTSRILGNGFGTAGGQDGKSMGKDSAVSEVD